MSVRPHNELQNYFVDLESLSEDTSAVQYWLSKEPHINKLDVRSVGCGSVDLVAAPAIVKSTLDEYFRSVMISMPIRETRPKEARRREFS